MSDLTKKSIEKIVFNNRKGIASHQLFKEFQSLQSRLTAAEQFKTFVHSYMDQHGVPHGDPENQHQKEGCRIGARLDLMFAQITAAEKERDEAQAQLNLIKKYPAKCDDGLPEIVDFVEMERIEQERDQFREELEKAREQLSAQTNTITALCLAIDPDCKHGPETVKLADYAIKTRKLALDIATNPLGNLNYVASKQKEIRQHLDFQHTVNGGIANE